MFTFEEIDLLSSGLDELAAKSTKDDMVGMLLGTMLSENKEQAKQRLEEAQQKRKEQEGDRIRFKERIILVKAKLINLKDKVAVEVLTES